MRLVLGIIFLVFMDTSLIAQAQSTELKHWIRSLCDSAMGGRPAGTPYETIAANFIRTTLKRMGIVSKTQSFQYPDPDQKKIVNSDNIYVHLNNKADTTIVLGAHYDHLGGNLSKSKELRAGKFHPGANDNASGVALMFYLLQHRKQWLHPTRNYLIVFYSAHEPGLFGSEAFYHSIARKLKIKIVLNLDMVGRLYQKQLHVASTLKLPAALPSWNVLESDTTILNLLDTKNFYQHQIPCISVSTGQYAEYHSRGDTEDKINYQGILDLAELLIDWLRKLG